MSRWLFCYAPCALEYAVPSGNMIPAGHCIQIYGADSGLTTNKSEDRARVPTNIPIHPNIRRDSYRREMQISKVVNKMTANQIYINRVIYPQDKTFSS